MNLLNKIGAANEFAYSEKNGLTGVESKAYDRISAKCKKIIKFEDYFWRSFCMGNEVFVTRIVEL